MNIDGYIRIAYKTEFLTIKFQELSSEQPLSRLVVVLGFFSTKQFKFMKENGERERGLNFSLQGLIYSVDDLKLTTWVLNFLARYEENSLFHTSLEAHCMVC